MDLKKIAVIVIALIVVIVTGCAGMETAKKPGKDGASPVTTSAPASSPDPVKPGKSGGEVTVGDGESISKSDSMKTADKSHIMKELEGPTKKRTEAAEAKASGAPWP
ncbi:MAG: hypothetical protein WCW53_07205, partial [Syntrophales bacterium]